MSNPINVTDLTFREAIDLLYDSEEFRSYWFELFSKPNRFWEIRKTRDSAVILYFFSTNKGGLSFHEAKAIS